jgi:hypothetical protein
MENSNNNSIIDKIMNSSQQELLSNLELKNVVKYFLDALGDRERDIIRLRHGLEQDLKHTLEDIGTRYKITRERVRQIEKVTLKKIKKIDGIFDKIKPIEQAVVSILEKFGGALHEDFLRQELAKANPGVELNANSLSFVLLQFLGDRLAISKNQEKIHDIWRLPNVSIDDVAEKISAIENVISKSGKPLKVEMIVKKLEEQGIHASLNDPEIVKAYLHMSKNIEKNPFDEWGFVNWDTVALKKMSDKVHLVLEKVGKPLHFKDIANEINKLGIDKKKANAATIHNELILNKRYVLVGRGIYALTEWGYVSGVVSDVIIKILKDAKKPLAKETIAEEVLKQRMVKKSTVYLALMNKKLFVKLPNGNYQLAN